MTHARQRLFTSWILLLGAVAGCSTVDPGGRPDPERAYLYGRFSVVTHGRMFMQFGAVGNASLVVACENGEEISVPFRGDESVQLLQLKPARCALAEMRFKGEIGQTLKSTPTPVASVQLDFTPGTAHYIGDWGVDVERERVGNKIHSRMKWRVADRYESTSLMLRAAYPGFASFATENRLKPPRSDEFVNCVSEGKRIWTYRSKCD